jgi:hypothetical protein
MSVYGNVTDLNSSEVLSGITIYFFKIENEENTTIFEGTSDSNGFYKVKYLEPGLYRFQIIVPEMGNIYIFRIGTYIQGNLVISKSGDEDYLFEISEGKNFNLNIFLGENYFPNINRIDVEEKNQIDFYLYYVNTSFIDNSPSQVDPIQNKKQVNSQNAKNCPGLFIDNVVMHPVADTDKIMLFGNECNALYTYQQVGGVGKIFNVGLLADCPKPSCKCTFKNFKGRFYPYILYHSDKWVKDTWKNKKNIRISDSCATCLNQSMIIHEEYHASKAIQIITDEYCDFQKRLLQNPIRCTSPSTCNNKADLEFYTALTNMASRMRQTESGAFSDQKSHYDRNCLRRCNNIPFWTIIK